MPDDRSPSPYPLARLPTLTEVLELGSAAPAPAWADAADPPVLLSEVVTEAVRVVVSEAPTPPAEITDAARVSPVAPPDVGELEPAPTALRHPEPAPLDPDEIVARVLAQLEPRIATLLEVRVNEALAPALARAADGLIRDSREQLGVVLHELVRETLAQVLRDATRFERHAP